MSDPIQTQPKPESLVEAKPAQQAFKPTWAQRLGLFAVGASHEPHYTNRDVRSISAPGALIGAVAPFMGIAAGMLVMTFAGLSGPLAIAAGIGAGVFWAGMTAVLDRTLVSQEARSKAMDAAAMKEKGMKPQRLSSFGMFMKRLPALGLRLGLAAASSFVVSETIVTTVMYKNDIEKVLDNRFKAANRDLITYNDNLRKQYDARTDELTTDLTAQKQRLVAQQDSYRTASVPPGFDRSAYDVKIRALGQQQEELQQRMAQAQETQSKFQAAAQAEAVGAKIGKGSTGHAGKGAAYNAAVIQFQQASQSVDTLKTQIATVAASIETVRHDMDEALHQQADEFHVKTQNLDQNVRTLTASIARLTEQVESRQDGRDQYFQSIKDSMERDPRFVPHEQGLLNSLSGRDELLRMEENTGSPFNMAIALWVLLGMVEMSPIIAAALRPATKSELRSAVDDLMSDMKMTAELNNIKTAAQVQVTQNGILAASSDELEKQAKPKAPSGEAMRRFDQIQADFLVDSGVRQVRTLSNHLG